MKLQGKVAIVTGASRGLGKAMAVGLAAQGAEVVVVARTETEKEHLPGTIHQTAEEIRALGRRALAVRCDVGNEQDVEEMVRRTVQELGRIDVLVNNAGIAIYAPIMELPLRRWELVLRVNLTGTFLCSRAVLPHMVAQRRGSIINLSSVEGDLRARSTLRTGVVYGVTKHAIERFTYGLAAEVGQYNIAVNCLKPKWAVDTEGMRYLNPDSDRRGWDTADMMVKAAVFLACQDASGVTGIVATDEELCQWHALI